jgi:CBS domain-containing protein
MQVREVMHEGVETAQITDSLKKVAAVMKREDIGGMPVYKNMRPVGFVTDRDIVISSVASGHSPDDPVSLAMRREIIFVYENDDITKAINLMEQHQISRLLVVDEGERPVGMLSLHDLTLYFDNALKTAEVLSEIKR